LGVVVAAVLAVAADAMLVAQNSFASAAQNDIPI
jgi:hypothetical protein